MTENQGRDEIRRQANNLNLPDHISDKAFSVYKLACNANFIQGRRVNIVASCCLYVACRRDKENTTLMMDFSETISVNVFKLGQTYQDLKKTLVLSDNDPLGIKPVIDVEHLIMKFARKLEFGNQVNKVASDACKIIRRMKRDWMVTGRRPAGLCGACIILAARMNNFRRTVREVVYVVKVADMTVAKRLEEFGRTQASNLSVDQFRAVGERLKVSHDPPALYESKLREMRKENTIRKRKAREMLDGDGEEAPVEGTRSPSATPQGSSQARRVDTDGFAVPAVPIDPTLIDAIIAPEDAESTEPPKKKRGRPPREPLPEITEADLVEEEELEEEMEDFLNDPTALSSMEDAAFNDVADRAKALADTLRNPETTTPAPAIRDDPEIGIDEFENDPEVRNCLLSETERKIKERIWVTHNEDWLRSQQAKHMKKAMDEANGITGKPKKTRAKKGRMGDGSVLEGGTPVEDAADANQRMLEKRAKTFSKHINYDKLNKFYAAMRKGKGGSGSGTATDATTSIDGDTDSVIDGVVGKGAAVVGKKGGMLPTPEATQENASKGGEEGYRSDEWVEEEDEEEEEDAMDDVLHEAGVDVGDDDDFAAYGYGDEAGYDG